MHVNLCFNNDVQYDQSYVLAPLFLVHMSFYFKTKIVGHR